MGIPLAALSLRPPPQQPSPIEQYGQAVQLKNLLAAQQMLPLELQQRQQQVQLGQIQLQAQQAMAKAYSIPNAIQPDENGVPRLNQQAIINYLKTQPGGGLAIPEVTKNFMTYQEAVDKHQEQLNKNQESQRTTLAAGGAALKAGNGDPALTNLALSMIEHIYPKETSQIRQNLASAPDDQTRKIMTGNLADLMIGQSAPMVQAQARLKAAGKLPEGETPVTAQEAQILQDAGIPVQAGMSHQTAATISTATNQKANRELRTISFQALEAQRNINNEMAEMRLAESKERGEEAKTKQEMTWIQGQDPKTGKYVAVPLSQARDLNLQNKALLDNTTLDKVLSARDAVELAEKTGPENAPPQQGVLQLVDSLAKDGKLGIAASRLNSFLAGGVGTSPGDDTRIISLLDKADLFATKTMQAHFGASGGRSPQMLEHFLNLANVRKMDATTLRAAFGSVNDYMRQVSKMPAAAGAPQPGGAGAGGVPSGATHKAPGSDGKMHYTNAAGNDLGVVP